MPQISGTQVEKKTIIVEVSDRELYETVIETILHKNPELKKVAYINGDGQRMIVSGIDYHHNEEEYSADGPATLLEQQFFHMKGLLWNLLK